MLGIGILGIGFMGKTHFDIHRSLKKKAKVAAICDGDPVKRAGDWSAIAGNIGGAGQKVDLKGVNVYAKAEEMFADPAVDVVDICLPTYLHAKFTVAALKAGKHVICEKPMAMSSAECAKMIAAAKAAKKQLYIGQCIRFWPEYAAAKKIMDSKQYGKVITAVFQRRSMLPTWSWENWLMDPKKSGLDALDLHVHDADFVAYAFGLPRAVVSVGTGLAKGRLDHIVTSYEYPDGKMVIAEGAWEYNPSFPFSMQFAIHMEKASLSLLPGEPLTLHLAKGKKKVIKVPGGTGYDHEMAHFLDCIAKGKRSDILTPESAMASIRLVENEIKSAHAKGKRVVIKK